MNYEKFLWTTASALLYRPFVIFRFKCNMKQKYKLLAFVTLLGLLMITLYIAMFASYKPLILKLSFNSITIKKSQLGFSLSKNVTTKKTLTLRKELRSATVSFSPSKWNLIIKLFPETGLANRLFMYPSALGIALENNRTLEVYPPIPEMQTSLSISSPWISSFKEDQYPELKYKKCCCYYPESQHLEKKNLSLSGYLASWKYFHKYRDIIVREFQFNQSIREHTNNFLSQIKSSNSSTMLIGVHIRRGDFLVQAHVDMGYTVATEDYVKKAVQYFQDKFNCIFVIATNDRTWAESVFSNLVNIEYVFTGIDSPYIDISIISSCDHVITTTGTFGWWIGYLSKGTVLYYKKFPKEGSWLKTTQFCNMRSYFFPQWFGLS